MKTEDTIRLQIESNPILLYMKGTPAKPECGFSAKAIAALPPPFAVRSSAVDEDGATTSFAGQHLTVLNVHSAADVPDAVREV